VFLFGDSESTRAVGAPGTGVRGGGRLGSASGRLENRKNAGSAQSMTNEAARRLRAIKLLHTAVWAMFAGCIAVIPVLAWQGRSGAAAILAVLVLGEVVVLWLNRWSCPLTAVAARYTDDRRANFDIYLPEWLARYNKQIFGPLYVAGVAYAVARYLGAA
jgi:hypothetical protein